MARFMARTDRKPEFNDTEDPVRQLAREWTHVVGLGMTEEEIREYYSEISKVKLEKMNQRLLAASGMSEPMDQMINSTTKNEGIQSCPGR